MVESAPAVRRVDVLVAAATGVVAGLVLLGAGLLAVVAPREAPGVPVPWSRPWWVGLAVVAVQALVLVWRRRAPGIVLLTVAAAAPAAAALDLGGATGVTSTAALVAAYTVAVAAPVGRVLPLLAAAAGLLAAGEAVAQARAGVTAGVVLGSAALQGIGTLAVAVAAGVLVRARHRAEEARVAQERALAGERTALAEAAVARERAAMARELHDIAAHHLSGIAVITGAIGRQIDTDPEGAKAAVRQVREQSTAMLRELRSLVALLRDDAPAEGPDRLRPEDLAGLGALVGSARAAGVDAVLTFLGPDRVAPFADVGPLAQLAAYRTVQESLANVVRHAPGARCEVVVDARDPAAVEIAVRNGPPRAAATPAPVGGGFGLVGMRERAELTQARLSHGPTPEGGWQVRLRLPVEPAPDETAEGEAS